MPFRRIQPQPPSKQVRKGAGLSIYADDLTVPGVKRLLALATVGDRVEISRSYGLGGTFGGISWEGSALIAHVGAGAVLCRPQDPTLTTWWMFLQHDQLTAADARVLASQCSWFRRDERIQVADGSERGVVATTIPGALKDLLNRRPDLASA